MNEVREPIVILGAPRSGTTMLAAALGAHPDCARTREARLVWRYGNDGRSDQLAPEHATERVVAHIRRSFAEVLRRDDAGHRLVEKTPANAVRPWFVDAVFPDARYVHITRDGWGCVPSISKLWLSRATGFDAKQRAKAGRRLRESRPGQLTHYAGEFGRRLFPSLSRRPPLYGPRIPGLDQIVEELGVVAASAAQWRSCVTTAAAFGKEVGPDRYLEVKVEQLDVDAFRSVLAFCGLAVCDEVVERFAATYDPALAHRQSPLPAADRRLVAPMVDPVNAWLGYTAATVP